MAFVATITSKLDRYWSKAVLQNGPRDEICHNIKQVLKDACEAFKKQNNGIYPKKIVLYRDGVGDSQVLVIIKEEIEHIKAAIKDLEQDIKFVFVMANKRVKTKFMA